MTALRVLPTYRSHAVSAEQTLDDAALIRLTLGRGATSAAERKRAPAMAAADAFQRLIERHQERINLAFCDGHAKSMKRSQLDDMNGDGRADNGYYNGLGDSMVR